MTARQIPGGAFVNGTTSRQIPGGQFAVDSGGGGSGSNYVPPAKGFTLTGYAPVVVRGAPSGTLTVPAPLKNNTATVQASISGLKVTVTDSNGTFVITKVAAADASGNFSVADPLITAGLTYYALIVDGTGGRVGCFKAVAT